MLSSKDAKPITWNALVQIQVRQEKIDCVHVKSTEKMTYVTVLYMLKRMRVKVVNKSKQVLPKYETEQSAGMDLKASIAEPIEVKPLERKLIPTDLYMSIPSGYEIQIRSRSGLALKKGIFCLNSPGTIDARP